MNKISRAAFNLKLTDSSWSEMDVNEIFIEACMNGDFKTVSNILEQIKDFDINVIDNMGRSALRLAVANEHIEVIQLLLNKSDSYKIKEALLHAIYIGNTQIAQFILLHPQYNANFSVNNLNEGVPRFDSFWETQSTVDAQFSSDITPIMLASHYNRAEIVQMLLDRGDHIEKPHDFYCDCLECINRFEFDSLRNAQSRLNAYKGLASEVYISLASIDPILTSFVLRHEMIFLADKEKYFKSDYLELANKLSEFVCKLLNNVRGRDELEVVLNKIGKENEERYERLARIDLALKYQEMKFVAHPNCQQKLDEIWNSGIRKITKMNPIQAGLLYSVFIFFIPLGSLIYIVMPRSKLGRFMGLPFVKFFSFTMSYLVFIGILIQSSLQFETDEKNQFKLSALYPNYFVYYTSYYNNQMLTYRFPASDMYMRNEMPSQIDYIICVWLIGLILREIRKLIKYGFRNYLFSWTNILITVMHILFIFSYALKYYTKYRVKLEKDKLSNPVFWQTVANPANNLSTQKSIYESFYWLNADRFYWHPLDPVNLAEALFAFAIILSFSRLCFWLPANQNLGPLQLTLGAMITDILKFICIFMIVFSGFLFGLFNLYWYYNQNVRSGTEISQITKKTNGEKYFGSIGSSLITMFFAIYTIGSGEDVLLSPFRNELTPTFGSIIFGTYHITNIVVMISLLIAMLTKSFESVLEHSDVEWKFSRTKLYMEYIKESSVLPIPLNIIPTPALIFESIRNIFCLKQVKKQKERNSRSVNQRKNISVTNMSEVMRRKLEDELTFKKVMERVSKRFLLHNLREENIKESDFDQLKQDVQTSKVEMINDAQRLNENITRYAQLLHKGLELIGSYFINEYKNNLESVRKFEYFKSCESDPLFQQADIKTRKYSRSLSSRSTVLDFYKN